ncbi:MAG: STAS domain-containing protein [Flavobacteriaceae bacterium]|nr:STAS domain-containing protein [Flavobacteriaceae bacterium]
MALLIKNLKDIFYLKGTLNQTNSSSLRKYFEALFTINSSITININEVSRIENSGVECLKFLHKKSKEEKKKFIIVGLGSEDIYDQFLNFA